MVNDFVLKLYMDLVHKSSYGPCIRGNRNLRIVMPDSHISPTSAMSIVGDY